MYLSTLHPEIFSILEEFSVGIFPARSGERSFLVIKASKEIILTAKVNRGFKFYLAPVEVDSKKTLTLLTAFFDDEDEPLVIKTPLLANDEATDDILLFMRNNVFDVCFFDEHNRELLSYKASGQLSSIRDRIALASLPDKDATREILDKAHTWFGLRSICDDEEATEVTLIEPLFPDDFVIMDLNYEKHLFNGSQSFSSVILEREDPGPHQEIDIVFLLQRVYEQSKIFLNPIKAADGEELVDVMVLGDEAVLLIQAKDSPNTEKILRTTIGRKRIKSLAQLKTGTSQLRGAISEIKRNPVFPLKDGEDVILVNLSGRQLIGMVVVKELFDDNFSEYSSVMFEFLDKSETPAVFFDYPELSMMTLHCNTEEKFLSAVHQILYAALELDEFPRLRYSGRPTG